MWLSLSHKSVKRGSSIDLEQEALLELLARAIGFNSSSAYRSTELIGFNWDELWRLACMQTVAAQVADEVLKLEASKLPERRLRLEMAVKLDESERYNKSIRDAQAHLYDAYEGMGLRPVLLKGTAVAELYPKPLLRTLGDIDFFFPREEDYDMANTWAKDQGYRMGDRAVYEQLYWYGSIAVENHELLTYFNIDRYNRALQAILNKIDKADAWAWQTIDGKSYRTLPIELNAVYIFHHILHHFSYMGVGLRHIADWLVLMSKYTGKMDNQLFLSLAEQFDLLRPMRSFAAFGVRYLGCSASVFPFDLPAEQASKSTVELIRRDIFRGGNFGFEHFRGRVFSSVWSRRWFMLIRSLLRAWSIYPISPTHIPLAAFKTAFNRIKLSTGKVQDAHPTLIHE